jgi:hypothetical protein
MPMASTVPPVAEPMSKPPRTSGSIADRLSTAKAKSANGKSFTIANAAALGGLGATIGLLRNSVSAPIVNLIVLLLIPWTIGSWRTLFQESTVSIIDVFVGRSLLAIAFEGQHDSDDG